MRKRSGAGQKSVVRSGAWKNDGAGVEHITGVHGAGWICRSQPAPT